MLGDLDSRLRYKSRLSKSIVHKRRLGLSAEFAPSTSTARARFPGGLPDNPATAHANPGAVRPITGILQYVFSARNNLFQKNQLQHRHQHPKLPYLQRRRLLNTSKK